ncbi:uncharacterized protein LOC128600325 isoform X2 [Ictalurus furcatus]|uniref:uncharacterized protein LOC128600325 isoform X2 n=1 Tax=Ictalurus furcatus TaxID=66913 RepID=UPI00234FFA06|nr:uncharacterized protein LOC128600325 isoform X2 [Ictalurus furcatus]
MSAREDSVACMPLCQGFLKKRKDKIRLRWVTYWFKLHNATLFFYNKKHGSTSDLRGQYCLIEVESVREIMWTKKKHYIFEIAMKNGKRKVLAAETADLRQKWMCQLLQAMNHHVYNSTEPNSNWETTPDYMYRTQSSPYNMISNSESVVSDMLVRKHRCTEPDSYLWSPSMHSAAVISTTTAHIHIDLGMSHVESSHYAEDEVKQKAEVIELENDYDVLPLCKPLHSEEVIYDTPPSNRRASEQEQETTENIYDVPKYALRKKSVNEVSCAKELPEISGLLQDMVVCLGGNSADWVRANAPEATCQS